MAARRLLRVRTVLWAVTFNVLQESGDQRGVEIRNIELTRPLVRPIGRIAEEESDGVTVGSDGVRARASSVNLNTRACRSRHHSGMKWYLRYVRGDGASSGW